MQNIIFNDEFFELIKSVEAAVNSNAKTINETDVPEKKINEYLKRKNVIIVTAKITLNELTSWYRYFVRIGKIAICGELDGYTLYEIAE